MKIRIRHEIKGRMRVHLVQNRMTCSQADILLYYLQKLDGVTEAKVYERTQDAVICYRGDRAAVLKGLQSFRYDRVEVPEGLIENSGREMNARYQEKLVMKVLLRFASKLFVPWSLRALVTAVKSVKYLKRAQKRWQKGKSRFLSWMRWRSAFPCSAGIWTPPLRSCSCSAWESFWRNGRIKSPWEILPGACP